LLLIRINDIDDSISSEILKFADSTKMYCIVNNMEAIESLHSDLPSLVSWTTDWQMLLNLDKC